MSKDGEGWYRDNSIRGSKRHYYLSNRYGPLCGVPWSVPLTEQLDHDDNHSDNCKRCLKVLEARRKAWL